MLAHSVDGAMAVTLQLPCVERSPLPERFRDIAPSASDESLNSPARPRPQYSNDYINSRPVGNANSPRVSSSRFNGRRRRIRLARQDRKGGGEGKSVSVRVDLGCG